MNEYILTIEELKLAQNALKRIFEQSVNEIELIDTIPPSDEIPDSNKVFNGKLSVLFVDIRKSTELTDQLNAKKMVKIYRAYTRMVIQAIRYSGGYTRQFAGDGIMGVFQDGKENDACIKSSQKAVNAARYIHTLIDFYLNSELALEYNDLRIGCGIGICTGSIMITKVGMRGKEVDDTVDNETGIVWVGSTTNYANRLCSLAVPSEIFIDQATYDELDNKLNWNRTTRIKGDHSFKGYTVQSYYLSLPAGVSLSAIRADISDDANDGAVQSLFSEMQSQALQLIDEISQKSAELSLAIARAKEHEQEISDRDSKSQQRKKQLDTLQWKLRIEEQRLDERDKQQARTEYNYYIEIFRSAHCKREFAIGMGKEFWNEKLRKLIKCGENIGLTSKQVKSEICCYLVDLYSNLGDCHAAYDALCLQAETHSWIHTFTVERILNQTKLSSRLKEVIETRLKSALEPDLRNSLLECLAKIKT